MSFDDGMNMIIVSIDPSEGQRYVETVRDERELNTIYNITSNKADCVEPSRDGKLSWENKSLRDGDSEQALEDW